MPVQPRDAREASDVFYKQKTGDALLTYENEVIVTNESMAPAKRLPYVVPQYNISVRSRSRMSHEPTHRCLQLVRKTLWAAHGI